MVSKGSKRITQERVIAFAKEWGLFGIPIGVIIILLMINLGVVRVTDYSGDMMCGGDVPCIADISFCVYNDTFIYPMNGTWALTLDGEYENLNTKIYRSWGEGWREIKLNETCKGTWCGGGRYGAKYAFAFRKGRCYDIRYIAESKNIYDKIKWSWGVVDPLWDGINWTIVNDTVFINDSRAYIGVTSYNVTGDAEIHIDVISKTYGGDLDIAFGVDDSDFQVKAGYVWKEWNVSNEFNYTCNEDFNYTLSPNYFWCYYEDWNGTHIVFEHSFDRGNIPSKTAWWNETEEHKEWKQLGNTQKIIKDYMGMNTWYIKKDIDVDAGREYNLKIDITPPIGESGKYFVCLKPSAETISEAIAADHFYCLDPWYYTLATDKLIYEIGSGYDVGWDNVTDYNTSTNVNVSATKLTLNITTSNGSYVSQNISINAMNSSNVSQVIGLFNVSKLMPRASCTLPAGTNVSLNLTNYNTMIDICKWNNNFPLFNPANQDWIQYSLWLTTSDTVENPMMHNLSFDSAPYIYQITNMSHSDVQVGAGIAQTDGGLTLAAD